MNNLGLRKKNIIITGALGLLGSEFVQAVIESGKNPILVDIDNTDTTRVLGLPKNIRSNYFHLYISQETQVKKFKESLIQQNIVISGLVNNAAINPKVEEGNSLCGLEGFDSVNWQAEVGVGLTGAILMTKHIGSLMANQRSRGSIVNISSDLGILAPDQRLYADNMKKPVGYSIIKHGIIGLSKYTATYWPDLVRCNTLCPGGIQNGQSEEFLQLIATRIPMGRMAHRSEYNSALNFLLSEQSSYMTGQTIIIDGGRTAW